MNVYGRAMADNKRQAHKNVVRMVLKVEPEEKPSVSMDKRE
jgi:hypothetical protein